MTQESISKQTQKPTHKPTISSILFSRNMLICLATGFSSGLPLYVIIQLLVAWSKRQGLDIKDIGLLALTQIPFTLKFLWAPFLDSITPLRMGRRRSWMLISQITLFLLIGLLGRFHPAQDYGMVATISLIIAFFAATQDIAIDAFRREILSDAELGLGNNIHVNAYRLAGFIPGSLAFILADMFPWSLVFWITAMFMLPGILMTLLVTEPKAATATPRTLEQMVIAPFQEFIERQGGQKTVYILLFIFLYKVGDSMAASMATVFYIEMGFSNTQIGVIVKNAGFWAQLCGGFLGGIWMIRMGIHRALWVFGMAQMITTLGLVWLAYQGPLRKLAGVRTLKLSFVIGQEALGSGLGTVALVAFIARCSNPAFAATQLALFTSLTAVPRAILGSATGWLVAWMGWPVFFICCTVIAIPGMLLLIHIAPWHEKE